ncbi:hypothetical protein FA95DRAFT_1635345 [Auriscalpium vulgare]|uniref:Uncharacterized protein n=1 Tax=Auriscalpium vulgare TaxID=40419 RepID=A0ACB8RF08_9AGAM|nr:hypothetical protein FA95DRAFT_1635345 [Auriscalpium vulgare]
MNASSTRTQARCMCSTTATRWTSISANNMGGTMRLGLRPTIFQAGTERARMRRLYAGTGTVWERHRPRYEVNPAYKSGMEFIGKDEKGERM